MADDPNIDVGMPQAIQQAPAGLPPQLMQAAQQQTQQQAALQAPNLRPEMPNIVRLISQMIKPTASAQPGQGGDQLQRPSRLDAFENFLGTFLTSFSEGMKQGGTGPGANARGFGAAMMAPQQQAIQQFGLNQQAATARQQQAASAAEVQEKQAQAQAQTPSIPMVGPDGQMVMIPPAHIGTAISAQYRFAGTTQTASTKAASAAQIQNMKGQQGVTLQQLKGVQAAAAQAASGQNKITVANIMAEGKKASQQLAQDRFEYQKNGPTAQTKSMAEMADTILPHITEVRNMIKTSQAKLGPVMGRWNEFMAGKVGTGDPDLVRLRTEIGLLQTGVMKAHVGARGGAGLLEKFEGLFNTSRMDAATLNAALDGVQSFMKGYSDMVKTPGGGNGVAVGNREHIDLTKP